MEISQLTYKTIDPSVEKFNGVPIKGIIYYLWYSLYHLKNTVEETQLYFNESVPANLRVSFYIRQGEEFILVYKDGVYEYLVYPRLEIPLLKNLLWGRR